MKRCARTQSGRTTIITILMAFVDLVLCIPWILCQDERVTVQNTANTHSVSQPFIIALLCVATAFSQFTIWFVRNVNEMEIACERDGFVCVLLRPRRVTKIAHIIYVSLAFCVCVCLFLVRLFFSISKSETN